jgi:hypothetical protein
MSDDSTISKPQGLRDLADYLERFPDATGHGPVRILTEYALRREEFIKAAARMGDQVEVHQQGRNVRATVTIGSVQLYATIEVDRLAGAPVIPQVDTEALAREIAAARAEAVSA